MLNEERILVVSQGWTYEELLTSIEIYVEGSNAYGWIEGPHFHDRLTDVGHIVSDDFALHYINTVDNIFLRLDCVQYDNCDWTPLDLRLKSPRYEATVSLIPDKLANCTFK